MGTCNRSVDCRTILVVDSPLRLANRPNQYTHSLVKTSMNLAPKENNTMPHKNDQSRTNWKEEIIITGNELVDRIRELVAEGNVRRLIIRKPDGDSLLEIPLTAGVVVGGAATLAAPVLAAIGALAALIKDFKLEVIRTDDQEDHEENHS